MTDDHPRASWPPSDPTAPHTPGIGLARGTNEYETRCRCCGKIWPCRDAVRQDDDPERGAA